MRTRQEDCYHPPVSTVTKSNGFPLPDVKLPSLVALSRIGPRTLQGPHQLSGGDGKHSEAYSTRRETRTRRESLL